MKRVSRPDYLFALEWVRGERSYRIGVSCRPTAYWELPPGCEWSEMSLWRKIRWVASRFVYYYNHAGDCLFRVFWFGFGFRDA